MPTPCEIQRWQDVLHCGLWDRDPAMARDLLDNTDMAAAAIIEKLAAIAPALPEAVIAQPAPAATQAAPVHATAPALPALSDIPALTSLAAEPIPPGGYEPNGQPLGTVLNASGSFGSSAQMPNADGSGRDTKTGWAKAFAKAERGSGIVIHG